MRLQSLLFGDANPGGKLPVTWPRSVGQVPIYYAHNLTQIPDAPDTRYWDGSSAPLYPFGYGLSYTSFKLDRSEAELTFGKIRFVAHGVGRCAEHGRSREMRWCSFIRISDPAAPRGRCAS